MIKACDNEVNQCLPCNDSPVENLSAELPDLPTNLGIVTIPLDPELNDVWTSRGCIGWAFSTISIADAEQQAAEQQCGQTPPPPPVVEPNLDVYYPWDPTIASDCSSFDCCGEGTPYFPAYATRPRVQIGAATYYLTDAGASAPGPAGRLQKETVDRFNAYIEENETLGRNYCYWTTGMPGSYITLMRLGSRWELYLQYDQVNTTVPQSCVCTANTGPPDFVCTAIGCIDALVVDYTENLEVYMPSYNVQWVAPDLQDYYASALACYTPFSLDCTGVCPSLTDADCYYRTFGDAPNQITIRDCGAWQITPDEVYKNPCSLEVVHWTPGVGATLLHWSAFRGVRMSSLNSGSPRGTYVGAGGGVNTCCGHRKATFTPFPVEAVVTLEVPPP